MNRFSKFMVLLCFGVIVLAGLASLLTSTVTYHPFGVPEHRREEYRDKMAEMSRYALLANSADATKQPVAVTEETTFDFGMVDPHATLSHTFVVSNNGALPLELSVRETSCKCTVGKLGRNVLLPGEETDIEMTWNTGYQADKYEQNATITTNDPLREEIELTVSGEVRAQCIAPEAIVFATADPGKPATTSFDVYSQQWDDFEIAVVDSDLKGFQWTAEPILPEDVALLDAEAKSAWRVNVSTSGNSRGHFSGDLKLTINPIDGSKPVTRELTANGRIRAPINFYSPNIHQREGLDIGTLVSGEERLFHLVVRSRGDEKRDLQVLEVKPDELEAFVNPMPKQPGSYRLTLKVPSDCPMVMFNADAKHGYVHVGDPHDKSYSNWFPVRGAVVTLDY